MIPGLQRSSGEGIGYPLQYSWASLVAQPVKNQLAQKQVDKALEKLRDLQGAMDDLDADLKEAEAVRNGWKPVGDLLIDSLQDHIEKTMVSIPASDKGF